MLGNGAHFEISKFQDTFRGDECEGLINLPKIYIFDCCRGADQDRGVNKTVEVTQRGTQVLLSSVSSETFCWYACGDGFKAFEEKGDTRYSNNSFLPFL